MARRFGRSRTRRTHVNKSGYRVFNNSGKPVHRWVEEKKLGHPLRKGAVVHHKDGNPLNNSPGNLVACRSQSEHMKKYHGK